MRSLKFLLQKEFRQIFRDRTILAMVMVMPCVQLLIMPLAANYEVKNINLAIVDKDHSTYSQRLTTTITASGYFKLTGYKGSYKEAISLIEEDKADLILEIPQEFERNLVREGTQKVFIAVNAINGMKAGLGGAYLTEILGRYNAIIRSELIVGNTTSIAPASIEIVSNNWYNPHMKYNRLMVPGVLAILVTMVGGFLTALNIVKEKEIGTIEQINVTPIKKHHFILGKLIPFWVLGNVVFTIGLLIARLVYGIIPLGNICVLYAFVAVYLIAILGFGLLVSTFCETQQQAMFILFFFMMIFILLGGLFTSIESMPSWAQTVTKFNPAAYLISSIRMVVLKGSGFKDVLPNLLVVSLIGVVLNVWAVINYKKTS